MLVNFISDLEDKYSEQTAKLALTAFVTNLKEANERVRSLTLQRTNERMGLSVGALKNARKATDAAYYALIKMVNALALVFGDKDYALFIDYVNTEVAQYKRNVIKQKATATNTPGEPSGKPGTGTTGGSTTGGSTTGGSTTGGSTTGGSTTGGSTTGGGGSSLDEDNGTEA